MEQYILECLDCHEIFPESENHTCRKRVEAHFTSKADIANKKVARLDGATSKLSDSTTSEDGTHSQSLTVNRTQTPSTTEDTTSDRTRQEMRENFESSIEKNLTLSFSSIASSVEQQNGDSGECLSVFESELKKSNLNARPILLDDGYNQHIAPDVSIFQLMRDSQSVSDNVSSTSNRNRDDFAGPSDMDVESHRRAEDGHFVCPICGKVIRRKDSFVYHYRTHTGEKPHACDLCEKKFITKGELVKHRRNHTGEKPVACDSCDKKFNTKSELEKHRRTHTGEKPFCCDVCEIKFNQKGNLDRHRQTHSKEKPYKCSFCGETFTNSSNLSAHIKNIHNEKQ